MSRFPNGRPDHLLGGLARPAPTVSDEDSPRQPNNGNGDDVSDGDRSFDDQDGPPSKAGSKKHGKRHKGNPKPKVPWIGYEVVRGWSAVLRLFTIFSQQCDCTPLVSKHGHASSYCITYRLECGYANRIGCPWQCQVTIWYDQPAAGRLYLRKHPTAASAPDFGPLDSEVYNRQTLFPVKQDLRRIVHANHICMVATAFVHSNHTGYCSFGAHCMWEAFCRMHAYALNFKRHEIQQWLEDRSINVIHERLDKNGFPVRTNQMGVVVERCKRFAERYRKSAENDTDVNSGYEGKLLAMCEKYCFAETARRLGHMHFDTNTPYIIPGWSACQDDTLPAGGFVVLISTMNLALNLARAHKWYAGNVTLAVDHTFKVTDMPPLPSSCMLSSRAVTVQMDSDGLPHICINVMAPDQSAHRFWSPPVCSAALSACHSANGVYMGCLQQQ